MKQQEQNKKRSEKKRKEKKREIQKSAEWEGRVMMTEQLTRHSSVFLSIWSQERD